MEHFFSDRRERLSVKLFVQLLQLWILMTLSQLHLRIPLVKTFNTGIHHSSALFHIGFRLSSAANASSRTGHDLNKIIMFSGFLRHGKESADIRCAIDHGQLKAQCSDFYGRFTDFLHAADGLECVQFLWSRFMCDKFVGSADGSLHDAACVAEDYACAGGLSHQLVEF